MRLLYELKGKKVDKDLAFDYLMARFEGDRPESIRKLAEANKYDQALIDLG
jgi:hypothetical protein